MRRIKVGMGWSEYEQRFAEKSKGNSREGKGEKKKIRERGKVLEWPHGLHRLGGF